MMVMMAAIKKSSQMAETKACWLTWEKTSSLALDEARDVGPPPACVAKFCNLISVFLNTGEY